MSIVPLTERATLRRVLLEVRPLPGHPRYWDWSMGILNVWLYADSEEGAALAAVTIIAALPYERVGKECTIATSLVSPPETAEQTDVITEQMEIREQIARESGLSLLFIGVPVGAGDETDFETVPI